MQRRSAINGESKRAKLELKRENGGDFSEEEGFELLASPLCFSPLHLAATKENSCNVWLYREIVSLKRFTEARIYS